ncbi:PREDICTED: uncharacterized protein LOC108573235, partial [Habropoda laboriosa]|uniref:uncharacterized protein LOC108573235 n=1 Tax=Habropoda laboriosa TaxID=597456 RepID=UPI00083DA926
YVHQFLESTIGYMFGRDITCREPIHRCDDYQPGVLTEFGRTGIKLFKKFLMPCGLCAAVPIMKPTNPVEEHATPCNNETQGKKLIKPSELPIYSVADGYSKQMPRIILQLYFIINVSNDVSNTLKNLKFIVDYLQDEANYLPRIGAVGIGGLSGLTLGLRGGLLKRLFYTSTGAGIVGCICFPREAKEALNTVEHYGNISYNFIYGVKPGDSKTEILKNDFPLLKSMLESKYFRMLSQPFEQKTSNATEKMENCLISKLEKGFLGKFHEDNSSEACNVSFHHNNEDSNLLEPVTLKETSPIEVQNSKNSKTLFK